MDADLLTIRPVRARLDVSTRCQLRCLLCPTAENDGRAFLGSGDMTHGDFVRFLDANPGIRAVELASAGESLLNPELPAMLESAADRGVATSLAGGVNLNDASDEVLEALVRCGTRRVRISIDGTTEKSYRQYRVGGSLRQVLANVSRLNALKKKYRSTLPELVLQFILFGHNEQELEKVQVLARMLDMTLFVKMNRSTEHLQVRDRERIRNLLGYADRREFREATGTIYCRDLCLGLWRAPQVNWDGRLLGCACNKHSAYADRVLGEQFEAEVNNERVRYARSMLMGQAPPREDIPCSRCAWFAQMTEHSLWITTAEVRAAVSNPLAEVGEESG